MENRKSKAWLGVVVFLILCAGIAIFVPTLLIQKKEDNSKVEEVVEKEPTEVSEEVKKKLKKFINSVIYYDDDVGDSKVLNGTTSLSDEYKLNVVHYNLKYGATRVKLSDDELKKMVPRDGEFSSDESYGILSISDFDNKYKELFNADASYTPESLKGIGSCPFIIGMNKELGKIYVTFDRCGGGEAGPIEFYPKILSYEEKDNNYIVTQEIRYVNIEDNTEKKYNLIWTFDNNINFISTVKE